VIIDTPPIGVVSDAIPLVHRVDGVVVVTRIGHSRRDPAVRLMKQLRELHANILGLVVNGTETPVPGDYFGYYTATGEAGRGSRPGRRPLPGAVPGQPATGTNRRAGR
jgi:Mrp family chromosome partitioning ATPase